MYRIGMTTDCEREVALNVDRINICAAGNYLQFSAPACFFVSNLRALVTFQQLSYGALRRVSSDHESFVDLCVAVRRPKQFLICRN